MIAQYFGMSAATQIALLSFGSALFYTASMVAMKLWTQSNAHILIAIMIAALVFAVALEIMALKQERLGLIYVTILASEVGLIAIISTVIFGEVFTPREMAGCLLIVIGTALAWA